MRNSLPHHPRAFNKVKRVAGIPDSASLSNEESDNVGLYKRKTDVVFNFGEEYPLLRITVKSFSPTAGYNHIGRKALSVFCAENRIKASDHKFLESLFLRKAKAPRGRRTHLVEVGEQDRVRQIFNHTEAGASALLGADHPQIFAVYCIEKSTWHLYDIQKQVLPIIRQSTITFTTTGRNIVLGDYIVLQRKGSQAGEHSGGHPITDIRHRANDVQVKMRVKRFFDEVEPLAYFVL